MKNAKQSEKKKKEEALSVEKHLANHREIDTSCVQIQIEDNKVVTLEGEIDNERAKQLAANIVSCELRKEVQNNLNARRDISEAPPEPAL